VAYVHTKYKVAGDDEKNSAVLELESLKLVSKVPSQKNVQNNNGGD
jgi:hypothetical protein